MPDFLKAAGKAGEHWYGTGDFDAEGTDPLQKAWVERLTAYGK